MKIFVISMKSYKERREFQIRQATKLNLEISFIDAVNGSEICKEKLQAAANKWTRPIFSKDIGCYLSHRKAWRTKSTFLIRPSDGKAWRAGILLSG